MTFFCEDTIEYADSGLDDGILNYEGMRLDETMLAGQHFVVPNNKPSLNLSRREFLLASTGLGVTAGLLATGLDVRRVNANSYPRFSTSHTFELKGEETIVEGQFTPYSQYTMGVNLWTRFGFARFNWVLGTQDVYDFFIEAATESVEEEQLLQYLERYTKTKLVLRPDVFRYVSNRIREAQVPSSRHGGNMTSIDLIKSVLNIDPNLQPERMLAPQALWFSKNKSDVIFTRADIVPTERWMVSTNNGKPVLQTIEDGIRYPALIVDCKGDSEMRFYADLMEGSETFLGYMWDSKHGGFYALKDNGDRTDFRIPSIPRSSLIWSRNL